MGQFHQHIYEKILRAQIPKVQKRQSIHQCLLMLLESAHEKAAHKLLVKLIPVVNFTDICQNAQNMKRIF